MCSTTTFGVVSATIWRRRSGKLAKVESVPLKLFVKPRVGEPSETRGSICSPVNEYEQKEVRRQRLCDGHHVRRAVDA